jgi:electron transfer flavoprotein alpha subunit
MRAGTLHSVSLELLAWGRGLADTLGVPLASVVLGSGLDGVEKPLFAGGADKVYVVDTPSLLHYYSDAAAKVLAEMARKFSPQIIIASATTQGRSTMPALSAMLEAGLTADCTGLSIRDGRLLQTRPAIGGNVMADIMTPERRSGSNPQGLTNPPQMCTVRPKSRRPLTPDATRSGEVVRYKPQENSLSSLIEFLSFEAEQRVGLPIQDADVIVAGGKGMKGAKNFALLDELAQLLNGSVGASRNAVDLGWAPYSAQVGLSGKSVTPRLYIACGISGAVQHLAGMSGAEKVIAVNTDPDAPIFGAADFGVVGSVLDVLPQLIGALRGKAK